MGSDIMTAQEAATYLRVSLSTLRRRARAGDIPGAKVGRRWRFCKADLDRWLSEGGDRYEELVDQGLLEATEEALAEPGDDIPLEEVRARLGL